MIPDIVVRQVAEAMGKAVLDVTGKGLAASAVSLALAQAEAVNLYNNLQEGRAKPSDVLAVVVALEGVILGAGVALTATGALAAGFGASIPLASIAVAAAAAAVFYSRNNIAIQDSVAALIDGIRSGQQPWQFIPSAISEYRANSYRRNVIADVNTQWNTGKAPPQRDPLAIDLDGDGIETTGIPATASGVVFDHDADGTKTGTGWLQGDDAWLVLDRNGNGLIDSGRELFGVDTQITVVDYGVSGTLQPLTRNARSGFEALRAIDRGAGTAGTAGYGDGIFDSRDADFSAVKLWQDLNQDGISQANELYALAARGITSIQLNETSASIDLGNGNSVTGQAVVTRNNGASTLIDSVDLRASNLSLADNPFYREFTDVVPATEQALALPDMRGSGWVRDLRESMSLGMASAQQLMQFVASYTVATTRDAQTVRLDALIGAWASTTGRLSTREERALDAIEIARTSTSTTRRLVSSGTPPTPTTADIGVLSLSANYYDTVAGTRVLKVSGAEVFRRLGVLETFNGQRYIDFTQTVSLGGGGNGGGGGGGSGGSGLPTTRWRIEIADQQVAAINAAYEALRQSVYQALVVQTRLRPYIDSIGIVIDELGIRFDTTPLTSRLTTLRANNAKTAIEDLADLVRFSAGTLERVGFDGLGLLRPWIASLPINSTILSTLPGIDVLLGPARLGSDRPDIYLGDNAANTFAAGASSDVIDGGAGDDEIRGESGNDTLRGGSGNDVLYGNSSSYVAAPGLTSSDIYEGGAGNDTLHDEELSDADVYRLTLGGGADQINEFGGVGDRIEMSAGITPAQVVVRNAYNNLVVTLPDGSSMTVNGMFDGNGAETSRAIEEIRFADTTVWNAAAIRLKASQGGIGADVMFGFAAADTITAGDGNDVVYARPGNDVIDGGAGDDEIRGESGNDTLRGGSGNDVLYGNSSSYVAAPGLTSSDIYEGGAGNDTLHDEELSDADVYRLTLGGGADQINEFGGVGDRIEMSAGIAPAQVVVRNAYNNLVVTLPDGSSMTVNGMFDGNGAETSRAIEEIRFADTAVWNAAAIRLKASQGGIGADVMFGFAAADTITAGDGNDVVYARPGNDVIDGGAGDDEIRGESGNDTLRGGSGNDVLYGNSSSYVAAPGLTSSDIYEGGAGNDTLHDEELSDADVYRLTLGGGADQINEFGGVGDRIEMSAGIAPAQVVVRNAYNNLVVTLPDGSSMTVNGMFDGNGAETSRAIEEIRFADTTVWNAAAIRLKASQGGIGADVMFGFAAADTITAGDGNDVVYARPGNDVIDGGAGDDEIRGESGNDTLRGGSGNDVLYGNSSSYVAAPGLTSSDIYEGGAGNDTLHDEELSDADVYRLTLGGGADQINEFGGVGDRIEMSAGITPAQVVVRNAYNNLVVTLPDGSSMTVNGMFDGNGAETSRAIEEIRFADTTVWNAAAIRLKASQGGIGADVMFGFAAADTITAGDGNDVVYARPGNDVIDGGAGDDEIRGESGNDTLRGGSGNDVLYGNSSSYVAAPGLTSSDIYEGGAGNDTLHDEELSDADVYRLTLGGGADQINEFGGVGDRIEMSAGIAPAQVVVRNAYNNLVVTLPDGSSMTVNGMFDGNGAETSRAIEEIRFADTTVWKAAAIRLKASQGGIGADVMFGFAAADTITAGDGNDVVYARPGNDVIDGGAGDDEIRGESGNDTLNGGLGVDTVLGGLGDDRYTVDSPSDKVIEEANEGTDQVNSSVSWTLGSDVEDLTLTGTSAISGTGNTLSNKLTGNTAPNTLDGGGGNDILAGGNGADGYKFGRGWGTDTIRENDATLGVTDSVLLQGAISLADLQFSRAGNNLELAIVGASDRLVLESWYLGNQYHVEEFRFGASVLTDNQAQALVSTMASFSSTSSTSTSTPQPSMNIQPVDYASSSLA